MLTMRKSHGAATVEFALVVIMLFMLVFGLIELGRALFMWNSAVDATRRGARTAAIVAVGDSAAVLAEMQTVLPALTASDITVEYSIDGRFPGAACVRGTCRFVRVRISQAFAPAIFFLPASIPMPAFSTTFPVEALGAV